MSENAIPVLQELGIPATWFVSGRELHGAGAYWWELLEHDIATRGLAAACLRLGLDPLPTPQALAASVEGTDRIAALEPVGDRFQPWHVTSVRLRELVDDDRVTFGFHTVRHPLLPAVSSGAAQAALVEGRQELSLWLGVPLDLLAYPHGRTNDDVADLARAAGYTAAWATGARAMSPRADRFRLPRWEPEPADDDVDAFIAEAALRLLLPVGGA